MLTVSARNLKNKLPTPQIVFEDDSLLILNKPAGWITNSASTTKDQPVIQSWLTKNYDYEIAKSEEMRSGVVHRLDKPTSGILIIAKTKKAFESLQGQFKERQIQKTYLALVHGKVDPQGEINAPVGRLPWNRRRFGILPGGREAVSFYKTIKTYKYKNNLYSLVEVMPKTGRTHQIRIHLKHINHPIVADDFYAGRKTARDDLKWCPRLFLHAYKINFMHPKKGERVEFEADLPQDLERVLENLV